MADSKEDKPKSTEERFKDLKGKIKQKETTDSADFAKQLATRAKLERDFIEDHILVTFNTSPDTRRTIKARRPNKKEFLEILNLSIQASKFEGRGDPDSLEKIGEIYGGLNKIAAKLCVDKTLNEEFWDNRVSFVALQNFIGELMSESQRGLGGMTEQELTSFRGK